MHIRTILHPTDHTSASEAALRYAAAVASDYAADLLILHVVDRLNLVSDPPAGLPAAPLCRVERAGSRLTLEYLLRQGDPVAVILRTAVERDCDLIVLGSSGRRGWRRLWAGSRCDAIARRAPCPVLVVRPPMVPRPAGDREAAARPA
jgi:nucleotide-binding universal stress UspA family protein